MRVALTLHPDSVCDAVTGIEVDVARVPSGVALKWHLRGSIAALNLPVLEWHTRANGLWRHTCFEFFVRPPAEAAYVEGNFAPTGQWAAYRFDGYRVGMQDAESVEVAESRALTGDDFYQAEAIFVGLPLAEASRWLAGVSTIIEETNGRLSYWALRHPPGKPDFHHPDCFALELPPPS